MTTAQEYDHLFKLLLIGNSSVGKSSLLYRFVDDTWSDNFVPTIGVDFKIKTMQVNDKSVKLQIWDTAGQERFKNITASYYRGGSGILVVYDISDKESFNNLNSWLIEIEKNAKKGVYKLLIGNKCDLEDKRQVSYDEGKEFAQSNGMKFMETSAKSSHQVKEVFEMMSKDIINATKDKEKVVQKDSKKDKKVELGRGGDDLQKKKGGCC